MKRFWGRQDVPAFAFLAALSILIYSPLTLQGRVLSSFDSLVYFYPNAIYLAERLRLGQIPLWDPYLFAGVPFLANSQVGALYPPNWLYLLGSVSRIYAVLVVLHVWWLGSGTYLVGRASLQLGRLASTFAATAVAFGGFVGGMNGHLNQLEALAWAPFAVLAVERAVVRESWRVAILAAAPFALAALAGHSQELYMTGILAGLAGLARAIQRWLGRAPGAPPAGRSRSSIFVADLLRLGVGPALATLIAAAQLVPTLELARLSIRASGLDFADASAFSLPPPLALISLLPTIRQAPPSTEWLGYVGVTTLVLALVGLWRRPAPEAWCLAGLAAFGLILAFGRYTPLYYLLFEVGPGVRLFRVPARWLTLWTFGAGLLAGWGVDALFAPSRRRDEPLPEPPRGAVPVIPPDPVPAPPPPRPRVASEMDETIAVPLTPAFLLAHGETQDLASIRAGRAQRAVPPPTSHEGATTGYGWRRPGWRLDRARGTILVLGLVATAVISIEAVRHRRVVSWPTLATLELWGGTLLGLLAIWLVGRRRPALAALALLILLATELVAGSTSLPFQNAVWIDAIETTRLSVDHLIATHSPDRVLALGDNSFDPGDLPQLRKMLAGTLPPAAQAEYITAVKHVEGLTPNLPLRFGLRTIDGYDGGVLPLDRFEDLKRLFPVQGPSVADGRLRLQLTLAPDPRLLGWLNVRYLMMNRLRDRWIDGVYYDLAVTQDLQPGAGLRLSTEPAVPATTIGVMFRAADGSAPAGTLTVDVGSETSSLVVGPGAVPGRPVATDVDPHGVWLWTFDLRRPSVVSSMTVTWRGAEAIALRSLSLIDRRTGANQPVVVSPAYRLDFLGDMKIYEDRDVLPRAFLANGLEITPNLAAMIVAMRSPTWRAQETAVASAGEVDAKLAFRETGDPGQAQIVVDQPERVVVDTSAPGRRVLVLTDSFYPGWEVTVDGVAQPILPVNILFRGVVVGPGTHQIVFSYRPASWSLGAVLSVVGLLATLAGLVLARR